MQREIGLIVRKEVWDAYCENKAFVCVDCDSFSAFLSHFFKV